MHKSHLWKRNRHLYEKKNAALPNHWALKSLFMSCNLNLWCLRFKIDYFSSVLISQISLNLTSLNKNVLLLVLISWVKNNVISSNSWNYSWISHSWHGTVLLYKHMNRLTTCCTAGLLCSLLPINIFHFSDQTLQGISHQSEIFTYHNQTDFSVQYNVKFAIFSCARKWTLSSAVQHCL